MVNITSIWYSFPLRRQIPKEIPGASVLSKLGEGGEGQLGCIRWTSVCNRTLIIQLQYVVYSVNRTNELVPMG